MKRTFICVLDQDGKIIYEGSEVTDPHTIFDHLFLNNRLPKINLKDALIGFESGSLSHFLMKGFLERDIPTVCMDARKLSPILSIKVNKTDKNDARGIAEALRSNMYTKVHCKPQESIDKSILLGARRVLVNQQTQLKNTVRGLLKSFGIRLNAIGAKSFPTTVKSCLEGKNDLVILSITALLNVFEKQLEEIEKIDKKMNRTMSKDAEVVRLLTIPGIGPVTAITYKTEIFDPTRFKNSRSVGAYLGMTPTQYASGDTQRQGKVSKCGSSELRFLLMEAGIVILTRSKKWSKLKAWGLKILRKKGLKKAAMAVGRKLAIIMHRMMLEKTNFIYGDEKKEEMLVKAI